MKLITTITDKEVTGKIIDDFKETSTRTAARAIVFNSNKEIAMLHATKLNFHKLPGGGLEGEEDIMEALKRELIEEVGCTIKVISEIGSIVELKGEYGQKQISYCFVAEVSKMGNVNLTKEEVEDLGLELKWVSINEALKLLESDSPEGYTAKFIRLRELAFLQEWNNSLK